MESFIDNCINKLKLKRFQVPKIPKSKKIPHFHHGHYDGEREDCCKQCRKENEINIITASSIRSRLKVFEFNSSSIKHKGDLSKKRAMKNLFELIEEESKENIEIDELQPNFSPVEQKIEVEPGEVLCTQEPNELLIESSESIA